MKRLSTQAQMLIAVGLIVVVAIAVVVLGILPLFQEAALVSDDIMSAEMELSTAKTLLARRQEAKAQAVLTEADLMRIANQVPDSPQLPSLIVELQSVANDSGVTLVSISVGGVEVLEVGADGVVPMYNRLPITIEYTGAWTELIDFNRRISRLQRGVRVRSTNFAYVPESEDTKAHVQGVGTIEVYMMPPVSDETSGDQ
jgi:Tfp pilus assembly protein PilO